jgi:hypothetical protein
MPRWLIATAALAAAARFRACPAADVPPGLGVHALNRIAFGT